MAAAEASGRPILIEWPPLGCRRIAKDRVDERGLFFRHTRHPRHSGQHKTTPKTCEKEASVGLPESL